MTHNEPLQAETGAIQVSTSDGKNHAVGFWNLRVLIVKDGRFWFAQGNEIDFSVQGNDIEDTKRNFEKGIAATIHHHLDMFGDIEKLLRPVPNEVWQEMIPAGSAENDFRYSHMSFHNLLPTVDAKILRFKDIEYAVPVAA